jgi:hypothetical protein
LQELFWWYYRRQTFCDGGDAKLPGKDGMKGQNQLRIAACRKANAAWLNNKATKEQSFPDLVSCFLGCSKNFKMK